MALSRYVWRSRTGAGIGLLSVAVSACGSEGESKQVSAIVADPQSSKSAEADAASALNAGRVTRRSAGAVDGGDSEAGTTQRGAVEDAGSGSERGPLLTCSALSDRYRACGLLGPGDFDCVGHLDACTALCELRAECDQLADTLCSTLADDSPVWRCLIECATGPGGYICEGDGLAIPQASFCDGVADCADASDERRCPATVCLIDWRTVVPPERTCDGVDDCFDGQDEADCPDFACDDGSELPHEVRCDDWTDCFDGSDERGCDLTHKDVLRCANGDMVFWGAACDGHDDCSDRTDERGCEMDADCDDPDCGRTYGFVCGDGSFIAQAAFCDQRADCEDGSDETCSLQCTDGTLIPGWMACDGEQDCQDGADEAGCDESFTRCDGFRGRDDWSDELGCCDEPPCAELTACAAPLPD